MKSLFKVFAWLIGIVVVLVAAVAIGVLTLVDPNDFKEEIAAAAKENTGRELTIEGDMEMTLFPWLGVKIGKVTLGNAPGFKSDVFAGSDRVEARVQLEPLLLKQELVMDTVTLHGLTVNLERDKAGKTNWADLAAGSGKASSSSGGSGSGGLASLALGGIDLQDAKLAFSDAAQGQSVEISALSLSTGAITPGAPVELSAQANFALGNPKLQGNLTLSGTLNVDGTGQNINVDGLELTTKVTGETLPSGSLEAAIKASISADLGAGTAKVADLSLAAAGLQATAGLGLVGLNTEPKVSGKIVVAKFNAKDLLGRLGVEIPATADANALTAVSVQGNLTATAKQAGLADMTIQLDETAISGTARVADFASSALRFELTVDKLDADKYLPPASNTPAATPAAGAARAASIPVETIRPLNIRGKLGIGQLKIAKLNMTDVKLAVSANKGLVRLVPVAAKLYGGSYAGNIVLDARRKAPKLSIDEKLAGIQISPLLKELQGVDRLSGTANVAIKATAKGADPDAMKKSLNGAGNFKFTDGALKGVNIAAMIRQAKATALGGRADTSKAPQQTDFSEMGGTFKIRKGLVSNRDFLAKSPLLRLNGKGTADLVSEAIDYGAVVSVVATAKGQGGKELADLAGLDVPVKIGGTFSAPEYGLDMEKLVEAIAKSELKNALGGKTGGVKETLEKQLGGALPGIGGSTGSGGGAPTDQAKDAVNKLKSIFN